MGLRPEAEGAHGWTAARSIQRDEWVQQERDVVVAEIEIAFVYLRCPGKLVQVLNHTRLWGINETSVFAKHDARYLFERLAQSIVPDLIVKLALYNKVDGLRGVETFLRLDGDRRANERHLQARVLLLHHLGDLGVNVETGRGGEQNQEVVVLRHFDGLFDGDFVWRGVDHLAARDHPGRVAKPHWIPIGFDLPRGRPAGTSPAVKAFKRRRIQKKRFHGLLKALSSSVAGFTP